MLPSAAISVRGVRKTKLQLLIQQLESLDLPESLDPSKMKTLTPGKVSAYAKKLYAAMAPLMEFTYHLSLASGMSEGKERCLELYAKQSGKIADKSGIQINTNVKNNSDNEVRSVQNHGVFSIDQIARTLRAGQAAPPTVGLPEPTPVREGPDIDMDEGDE